MNGSGSDILIFEYCAIMLQGKRDECYETRLRIQRVELNDARHYYLTVENDKGSDSFYVTLTVKGELLPQFMFY